MDDDGGDEVLNAASNVIESEAANVLIEVQMNKAVRLGTMLRLWKDLMVSDEQTGSAFSEEWVEHAAMDIFHTFFPETETQEIYSVDNDDED